MSKFVAENWGEACIVEVVAYDPWNRRARFVRRGDGSAFDLFVVDVSVLMGAPAKLTAWNLWT